MGTTIASCEGARKTPDVAKSSGNPSATVAGTQDQPTVSVEEISHPGASISPVLRIIQLIATARQCSLLDEDLDSNCDLWKSCVVGYVDGKFPGYKALHDIVTNTWQCEASLTFHDSGWLVYKFNSVDDKLAVLASGPYLVYGRPLILKAMPEYFNFSYEEMTRVPVWVKFPNLPLKCWSSECLSKISSVIGKPIQCDQLTSTMSRISYARVLVELDLLDDLIHSVDIILPNGTSLTQTVIYETLPRFCRHCKVLGHAIGVCSKATVESRTMGSHADMGSTKQGTASNGLVYAVDAGVEKNKGKDVAADHYCDPMQAEVDVMSADLETVRSKKSSKFQKSKNMATVGGCSKVAVESRKKGSHAVKHAGSTMPDSVPICMGPNGKLPGERENLLAVLTSILKRAKDMARAPQGWKQRGQEGALDGVKARSAHKGVATRASGSVFIAGVSAGLSLYGNCIGASALFVSG
nr:uncharacterized protein LOC118046314 [Populus alba]